MLKLWNFGPLGVYSSFYPTFIGWFSRCEPDNATLVGPIINFPHLKKLLHNIIVLVYILKEHVTLYHYPIHHKQLPQNHNIIYKHM